MRKLRAIDYFTINLYWFSLSYFLNGLGRFIQPVLVAALVPGAFKASALGILSGSGLAVATIVQPMMGALSDRSTLRWGRRRPFILLGTFLDLVFLTAVGLAGNYWLLFLAILFLQFSTNTAHGALQGLIPDLVPQEQRGRAVGVKQFLEILGLIITSLVTARLLQEGQVWPALGVIMAALVVAVILTLFWVKEEPLAEPPKEPIRSTVLGTFRVDVKRHDDYLWLLAARVFTLVGLSLVTTYALYFLQDVVRLPNAVTATGDLLATVSVLILLLSYPTGYLSDRLGRKPLNLISGPIGAFGCLLLLSVTGGVVFQLGGLRVTDILAYASLIGLSVGIFLSANWTWATDLVPREESGKYLGLSNLANAGCGVLTGFIGGPIIDLFNAQKPGQGYTLAFLLAATCFLVGTLLLFKVRETKGRVAAAVLASE